MKYLRKYCFNVLLEQLGIWKERIYICFYGKLEKWKDSKIKTFLNPLSGVNFLKKKVLKQIIKENVEICKHQK